MSLSWDRAFNLLNKDSLVILKNKKVNRIKP